MLLSNAHTHTTFCDGKNTPEEMLLAALDAGFVSLGFSIHGWTPYETVPVTMEKEAAYREELHRLREAYRDRIEVLIGIESDSLYSRSYEGYEYRIDSTHYFTHQGNRICVDYSEANMLESVRRYCGGRFEPYYRSYYRQLCSAFSKTDAVICGHIDLIGKFNEGGRYFDENSPDYLNSAFEAVDCALERGMVIEINTGAIGRGYRSAPYPSVPILRRIRERGGEIMINSDCHRVSDLCTFFPESARLAAVCGFDHVLRLRRSGFEEVPII